MTLDSAASRIGLSARRHAPRTLFRTHASDPDCGFAYPCCGRHPLLRTRRTSTVPLRRRATLRLTPACLPNRRRAASTNSADLTASGRDEPPSDPDELGECSHDLRGRLLLQAKQGHPGSIGRCRVLMEAATISMRSAPPLAAAVGQRESRRPRWLRVHAPTRTQVSRPLMTSVSQLARFEFDAGARPKRDASALVSAHCRSERSERRPASEICWSPNRSGKCRWRLPCIHDNELLRVGRRDNGRAHDGSRPCRWRKSV